MVIAKFLTARPKRGRSPWAAVLAVALLATLFAGRPAWSHPHVWIYATVTAHYNGEAIESLQIGWTFDEMYSSFVIEDYDADGSGSLDQAELDRMAADSVESLKGFSYLTYLVIGERRLTVDAVEGLRTAVVDDLLHYEFKVNLPERVDPRVTPFAVSFYDKEYYIDVQFDGPAAARLEGAESGACKPVLTEDDSNPIYFGTVYPSLVQFRCDVT